MKGMTGVDSWASNSLLVTGMLFALTLQVRKSVPGPCTASVDAVDCREPSLDHVEMMTTASAERVTIDEVDESDVTTPHALTTVTVDSVDHVLSNEHLERSAAECCTDEGRSAVATLDTDVGDQMVQEYEARLQTLGEFELEQLENVQVAIKVFLLSDFGTCRTIYLGLDCMFACAELLLQLFAVRLAAWQC